jgi:8-oxo-dGTP diphosphatase
MAPIPYAKLLAANIRATRVRRNLSQATVYGRMQALGFTAWHRQTISSVERGDRRVTADELIGLALALEVSIPALTAADADHDTIVELPNGMRLGAVSVERLARGVNDHAVQWPDDGVAPMVAALHPMPGVNPFERSAVGPAMAAQGWPEGTDIPRERVTHERSGLQPIVAVLVTSPKGVLITRRVDGEPPWGLISGEVWPGESPSVAAVREVKEEAGLEVRSGEIIGERDHPATGRHVIYLAARPVASTVVHVGDEAELAEVRWTSLAEAGELLPDMFGPARDYLERTLARRRQA